MLGHRPSRHQCGRQRAAELAVGGAGQPGRGAQPAGPAQRGARSRAPPSPPQRLLRRRTRRRTRAQPRTAALLTLKQ